MLITSLGDMTIFLQKRYQLKQWVHILISSHYHRNRNERFDDLFAVISWYLLKSKYYINCLKFLKYLIKNVTVLHFLHLKRREIGKQFILINLILCFVVEIKNQQFELYTSICHNNLSSIHQYVITKCLTFLLFLQFYRFIKF